MSNILLINPSYKSTYASLKVSVVNPVWPTLGLATIAATALHAGHNVKILDLCYQSYNPRKIRDLVLSFQPDIVGITATTPLFNQLRDMSCLLKSISKNILIIGGGSHVSALPVESLLESKMDVVVRGEGDYTFRDIANGQNFSDIPGIVYRDSIGEIYSTQVRPMEENIDNLPFPAWHLYDILSGRYKTSRLLSKRNPLSMIEFSRGCVFKCDFCASKNTMGLGYRKKSPERIADEMEYVQKLGFREVALADDIFTSDQSWAVAVCEAIIERNIDILWTCTNGIRVESANKNLFQAMKKAGCYRVSFGFESGNDAVLKKFGKGGLATIEQGKEAVQCARRAEIEACGYFLLGLSPDTEETMKDTIEYARNLELDMLKFGVTIAFPGTPMFQAYHQEGLIRSYNWDDYHIYTDEALFVHETLSYKTIQKYIHWAYQKAITRNPRFILRRILRGLKTGELFWDLYYFLRFVFLPETNSMGGDCPYAEQANWPTFDYQNAHLPSITYQKPKTRHWKDTKYTKRNIKQLVQNLNTKL